MRICNNCDQYRVITLCCKNKIREPQEYDGCYEFEEKGYKPFYDSKRPDLIEMREARVGFVSTQEEKEGE
jgi:hypothetical protein